MVATTRLGLNAQTPGTNANTWGGTLNDQVIALIDEAVAGVETIPVAGNMTLMSTNFVSNQARNAALLFTAGGLTGTATITIPGREKVYLVLNSTGRDLVFSAGGATVTLPTGRWGFIVCNGADVFGFDPVGLTDTARAAAESARDTAILWATSLTTVAGGMKGARGYANDAAASASDAINAYDAFDDRYLGAKSSDPTLDNDGNPLLVGAIYFNSTANQMRVYTGSAWIIASPGAGSFLPLAGGTMTGLIGLVAGQYSSQAEAQAGTDTSKLMTPQRTAQAIAALTPAPPVPGLVFISQQTVASAVASIAFTGLSNAYDEYVFVADNLIPATASLLALTTSTDGGATFDGGGTDYRYNYSSVFDTTAEAGGVTSNNRICIGSNTRSISAATSDGGVSFELRLYRPSVAQKGLVRFHGSATVSGSALLSFMGAGVRNAVADIDAVRFAFDGGNIVAGTIKLYGLRKS